MNEVQAKELHDLFIRRLRTRRKELGLTQIQLAERMDIDQSYISDLERGATRPRFDSLAPLAEALDGMVIDVETGEIVAMVPLAEALEVDPGYLVSEAVEFSAK